MTTINTIENRILEMDGGEFHKLCDAYLAASGYGVPHSRGSVAGANKGRKGTPDTFFERPDGKFIFAEYTTQKKDLLPKLETDLRKCLNESKTGVPIQNIEEITMCFVGELLPKEVLTLNAECQGVTLTLLGISAIANDLLKHPLLIRKYFNLSLDTGQIIPLESFPGVYGKSKFAITLETNFHFREKEKIDFSNAVVSNNLVIISGKAGVGKSRFALECCRSFIAKNPEYEAYAIVSQSQNLFEDLQERFSTQGNFLILVDDANRISSFSYLMYFLRNRREDQQIKVIATVRDYALAKTREDIADFPYYSIFIDRLTNDQIRELARNEFGILNSAYLERIVDLSGGNPRIAVMIAKIAIEKNTLESINDVSALYDEYFSSIKIDLKDIGQKNILRVAGIIAFHRAVDRKNEEMMSGIQNTFSISAEEIWEGAIQLHELEMVDMYENDVVRISDQVLSTYLFYLVFFKERLLDFYCLLQNYFPTFRSKINDSILPTLSAFDQQMIFDVIRPQVRSLWAQLEKKDEEDSLLILAESFYYLIPTETLSLVKKRLSHCQFAPADLSQLENLDDNKLRNIPVITEVQLLGSFHHNYPDLQKIALQILFDYLEARPADVLQVFRVLIDDFGFNRFSNQLGINIQQEVVNFLWCRAKSGQNELFYRLFIAIGEEFLKTHFQSVEMRSESTATMYEFSLQPTQEILQFRGSLLAYLKMLFAIHPKLTYGFLKKYLKGCHHTTSSEIILADSTQLISFIQSYLSSQNLTHIIFVNDYLDFLEDHKVDFIPELRKRFQNDTFKVYRLLSEDRRDFRHLSYEEFQSKRKKMFRSYFKRFSKTKTEDFIDHCNEIGLEVRQERDLYEFFSSFFMSINILSEVNPDLFTDAIKYYLKQGDKLNINPSRILQKIIALHGKKQTWDFLNEFDYSTSGLSTMKI
jgi:hypothetical protein